MISVLPTLASAAEPACSTRLRSPWALAVIATLVLALSGCDRSAETADPQALKLQIDSGDAATANVIIKVQLAAEPDRADLRFLLGRALLETGDAQGAQIELERAGELGHSPEEIALPMARAFLALNRYQLVVARYGQKQLPETRANADLRALVATAYRQQGQFTEAETAIADALVAVPGHGPATLLKANLLAARGDTAGALAMVKDVARRDPENGQAWQMRGQMEFATGDDVAAVEAFRRALKVRADSVSAHSALIALYLARDKTAEAQAQWQTMNQLLPKHPGTRLYEAKLALIQGDSRRARVITTELLRTGTGNLELLQLAGAVEWAEKSYATAQNLLGQAVQLAPGALVPRLMLAQAQIGGGQYDEAASTLNPLVLGDKPLPVALSLLAKVRLLQGDAKAADQLYSRSAALGMDGNVDTDRALARAQLDPSEQNLGELARIAARSDDNIVSLALISAQLAKGRPDAALLEIAKLESKQPNSPLSDELRGRVALAQRKPDQAARHFEAALKKDPTHYAAVSGLAALDMAARKPEAAAERFQALLTSQPGHLFAALALSETYVRRASTLDKVKPLLRETVAKHPDQPAAHLLLVEHLGRLKEKEAAVTAAQAGLVALPNHPKLLEALGKAQVANGTLQQATSTYNKLAAAMPNRALPHLLSAELHLSQRDIQAAQDSVRRARIAEPTSVAALNLAAALEVRDKRFPQAMSIAKETQAKMPDQGAGYAMEGELLVLQGDLGRAERVLQGCLSKNQAEVCVRHLYGLLNSQKRSGDADKVAANWLAKNPRDIGFHHDIGDAALARKDWAMAEKHFRHITDYRPLDAQALNNMAWLLAHQGKPGAVQYAEHSLKLSPNNPAIMDTLAKSHAAEQNLPKAIEWQRKAVDLAPKLGALRLNLAKLYIANGQNAQAQAELSQVVSESTSTSAKDEAGKLLGKLRSAG